MAFPPCSFCGQYECVLMLTSTADGDTVTPCGNCAPGFILTMAAGVVEGMTHEEAESHAEALDALAAVRAHAPAPAGRSGKLSGPPDADTERTLEPPEQMPGGMPLLGQCSECDHIMDITGPGTIECGQCGAEYAPESFLV